MSSYHTEKKLVLDYFDALEAAHPSTVSGVVERYHSDHCQFFGCHPFNELVGPDAVAATFWAPLLRAFSALQRRQDIFMAGTSEIDGDRWVMSMGHFMGLFDGDWLGIRATRKLAMLRYAEFHCVEGGRIVKSGMFCDIIGLMQQVGVNPLPPQTGASFVYPGPRTHDGVQLGEHSAEDSAHTLRLLDMMIDDLDLLNTSGEDHCPPDFLARTWNENMVWFGPAGIGATYTIPRYQLQHQFPFREGLTDKVYNGHVCRFAEGNYACFFGWPNLSHKPTGGFMGLPAGENTHMRVVDVYRREGERLLENWILIDIPFWLKHQGLDVLERTRSILNP